MVQINPQVYTALQAHISEHISLKAQGEIGAMIADDGMMQMRLQSDQQGAQVEINAMIAARVAELTIELAQSEASGQKQDPLVALKQRELDLRAVDIQRRADQDFNSNEIRENEIDERLDIEKMKLENNEDQAAERIRIADAKVEIARKRARK